MRTEVVQIETKTFSAISSAVVKKHNSIKITDVLTIYTKQWFTFHGFPPCDYSVNTWLFCSCFVVVAVVICLFSRIPILTHWQSKKLHLEEEKKKLKEPRNDFFKRWLRQKIIYTKKGKTKATQLFLKIACCFFHFTVKRRNSRC